MLRMESVLRSGVPVCFLSVASLLIVVAPAAKAQFGLPKMPKLSKVGKQEQKPPAQAKVPQGPAPEVTAITPNSVPPGWEGDVVFKGKNFSENMKLRLECGKWTGFHVESPERATFHLKVLDSAEETTCAIALEVPAPPTAETGPSTQSTPLVVEVTGATFSISRSSPLAQAFPACFVAEGDLQPMDLMRKLSELMQKGSQDECKLYVSSDSVKYTDQGKPVMDEPASRVKSVESVLMMGQHTGVFRMVMANGKTYNFFPPAGYNADNPVETQIKTKLKK